MEINARVLLSIPIGLLGLIIKGQYKAYKAIVNAQYCTNIFGTRINCSPGLHITIIIVCSLIILICLLFLFHLEEHIKFKWR